MSLVAQQWVYKSVTGTSSTEQAVLAYLAFRANEPDFICFPSHNLIAKETRFASRTVEQVIAKLKELGLLVLVSKGNKSGYNKYQLQVPGEYRVSLRARNPKNGSNVMRKRSMGPDKFDWKDSTHELQNDQSD